ncbi:MAG: response regulator [Actinobacteria bacterium]|nr:MAG: response regulator [Actinomycetota bacterium]
MAARILAVDDEHSIRKLVTVTLQNRGFEVDNAGDGEEALQKVAANKPDLIVLDVMMPKMDGWEVRRRLKEDEATKNIPIIFLTAVGQFESQLTGLESGLEDYLTKPFTPSALADLVEGTLNPAKHDQLMKDRHKKEAKLRTIVDIMHRSHE